MKSTDSTACPTSDDSLVNPTVRLSVSLFVIVHFFFVFTSMSANVAPRSELQRRLLTKFAFYTQLLNLDLDFAPYHLTHASEQDVDHRVEILRDGDTDDEENWIVLPDEGVRGGERYKRYQRLGRVMAMLAGDDTAVSWLASSVGTHFLHARKTRPQQVRCRRHMLQRWTVIRGGSAADRDPNSAGYFRQVYLADCVILSDNQLRVNKRDDESQVAQPTSSGQGPNP